MVFLIYCQSLLDDLSMALYTHFHHPPSFSSSESDICAQFLELLLCQPHELLPRMSWPLPNSKQDACPDTNNTRITGFGYTKGI